MLLLLFYFPSLPFRFLPTNDLPSADSIESRYTCFDGDEIYSNMYALIILPIYAIANWFCDPTSVCPPCRYVSTARTRPRVHELVRSIQPWVDSESLVSRDSEYEVGIRISIGYGNMDQRMDSMLIIALKE